MIGALLDRLFPERLACRALAKAEHGLDRLVSWCRPSKDDKPFDKERDPVTVGDHIEQGPG